MVLEADEAQLAARAAHQECLQMSAWLAGFLEGIVSHYQAAPAVKPAKQVFDSLSTGVMNELERRGWQPLPPPLPPSKS